MGMIISTAKKQKMLTGIREGSQGFRKVLDKAQEGLVEQANSAKYEGTDAIVNASAGLNEAISESIDKLDATLNEIAELYLKQNVMAEDFEAFLKKFIDSRQKMSTTYDLVQSPQGEEEYDSEKQGAEIVSIIEKLSKERQQYIEEVSQLYKECAGEDIADMIVPAFKKLEEVCNDYISELKKVIDAQASIDNRLGVIANGVNESATSMNLGDVKEGTKRKFGSVGSSKYLGDI